MNETAPQRLDRILKENNLLIAQNPLTTSTVNDGSVIVRPSTYTAIFADPGQEKQVEPKSDAVLPTFPDEPIPGEAPQKANG